MADEMVSALTAGVLSTSTVYRLLRDVGHRAIDDEPSRWEACFERGEDVCDGQQQTDVLYTEADGVWVHLQREEQPHYEVKSGIAYRGWRNVGDDRYELVGKRVYGHASEQMPFWKGASLEWGKQYALEGVKLFVVGGDGANWIRSGTEEFGNAIFQLDGSHLISRVWARLWQTDRNFCLRWHTCRINDGCPAGDVLSTTRTDQDGTQRQRVRRVQREYWNGLAQPGAQRSPGRAEPWEPWRATETSSLRTA